MPRQIAMVFNQTELKSENQIQEDLEYWLSKSPIERLSAVTYLVKQNLHPSQRMDKSIVLKRQMKA